MTVSEAGSWAGTMTDIGPLYPMYGTEGLLVLLLLVFWIGWHILQFRMENANYRDDAKTLKQNGNMDKALRGERVLRPM